MGSVRHGGGEAALGAELLVQRVVPAPALCACEKRGGVLGRGSGGKGAVLDGLAAEAGGLSGVCRLTGKAINVLVSD